MYQDSHQAFIRDDINLLQYIMRTPTPKKTKTCLPSSKNVPSSGTGSMSMVDEIQGLSSHTLGETESESKTSLDFIPMQQQQTHHSNFATSPYQGQLIFISPGDDDMAPRPIRELNAPPVLIRAQPYPVPPSSFTTYPNTRQVGSLLPGVAKATTPIRHSNKPWDIAHEQPKYAHPFHLAILPQARHVESLIPKAVTYPGMPYKQGFPQRDADTRRRMMSLPSLESKQWNQNEDDHESLETIEDIDSKL